MMIIYTIDINNNNNKEMITKKEEIMINIKNICITKKKLKIDKLIKGEEKILITIKDNMLDINKE